MNLCACTDAELLRMIALGEPTSMERGLADRLEQALDVIAEQQDDIDTLQGELRADNADEGVGP